MQASDVLTLFCLTVFFNTLSKFFLLSAATPAIASLTILPLLSTKIAVAQITVPIRKKVRQGAHLHRGIAAFAAVSSCASVHPPESTLYFLTLPLAFTLLHVPYNVSLPDFL